MCVCARAHLLPLSASTCSTLSPTEWGAPWPTTQPALWPSSGGWTPGSSDSVAARDWELSQLHHSNTLGKAFLTGPETVTCEEQLSWLTQTVICKRDFFFFFCKLNWRYSLISEGLGTGENRGKERGRDSLPTWTGDGCTQTTCFVSSLLLMFCSAVDDRMCYDVIQNR